MADKMEKMNYDQMMSSQTQQRILQMRKDRSIEKTKI